MSALWFKLSLPLTITGLSTGQQQPRGRGGKFAKKGKDRISSRRNAPPLPTISVDTDEFPSDSDEDEHEDEVPDTFYRKKGTKQWQGPVSKSALRILLNSNDVTVTSRVFQKGWHKSKKVTVGEFLGIPKSALTESHSFLPPPPTDSEEFTSLNLDFSDDMRGWGEPEQSDDQRSTRSNLSRHAPRVPRRPKYKTTGSLNAPPLQTPLKTKPDPILTPPAIYTPSAKQTNTNDWKLQTTYWYRNSGEAQWRGPELGTRIKDKILSGCLSPLVRLHEVGQKAHGVLIAHQHLGLPPPVASPPHQQMFTSATRNTLNYRERVPFTNTSSKDIVMDRLERLETNLRSTMKRHDNQLYYLTHRD